MSVPEGKMKLDLDRQDVWLLASLLNGHMAGSPRSEALTDLCRPILGRLNSYLEATDGPPPVTIQPHASSEEGMG